MEIITNNPRVRDKYADLPLTFVSGNYGDVLSLTKQKIIDNHQVLLTHPVSSSLKPNETFYKSIIVTTNQKNEIDIESLDMIDNAIQTYEKFIKDRTTPQWTDKILADFALIDEDLIHHALTRMISSPKYQQSLR